MNVARADKACVKGRLLMWENILTCEGGRNRRLVNCIKVCLIMYTAESSVKNTDWLE
jgi:hypothetical protein